MQFWDWLAFASLLVAFVVEAAGIGFLYEYYDPRRLFIRLTVFTSIALDAYLLLWLFVPAVIRLANNSSDFWGGFIFAIAVVATLVVGFVLANTMGTLGSRRRDRRSWSELDCEARAALLAEGVDLVSGDEP